MVNNCNQFHRMSVYALTNRIGTVMTNTLIVSNQTEPINDTDNELNPTNAVAWSELFSN